MSQFLGGFRMHVFSGANVAALLLGAAMPAHAQEAAGDADAPTALQEVVVTASRVQRAGFEAPTPTTVLNADTLQKMGTTDIGSALALMPAFQADQNASTNPLGSSAGRRYADLRNLGAQRTLVMLDGQRMMPSALTGQADLNAIPQILIDRVDVVTGGASAQWGSDAVAGVVNMVTKTRLEGFLSDVSFGESSRGDNIERHLGLAYGTDFGGSKLHLVAGGEMVDNDGVGDMYTRGWGRQEWGFVANPDADGTAAEPTTLVMRNVRRSNLAVGGLITSGPLAGTTFDENGQPRQFIYGDVVGSGTMSGGEGYGEGDGQGTPLKVPVKRYASQIRLGWDVSDNTEVFAKVNYAQLQSDSFGPGPIDYSGAGLTIYADNAYLPDSIRSAMVSQGIDSFSMGRYWKDNVYGDDERLARPATRNTNSTATYTLGAKGAFGDGWSWDAHSLFARSVEKFKGDGYRLQARFYEASDAVYDDNGSIVCRSTLTDPDNGCVPLNLFGKDSVTPEAYNYITGDPHNKTVYTRVSHAANLRGEPISTWAGPVSVAAGVEYRNDHAELIQTDPNALNKLYNYGNSQPIHGGVNVTEGYFETVVPLLTDLPLVQSLDFDGAIRETHYSTSGNISTWKAGVNYAVNDSVRFRSSLSRDIRAPNISELYTATSTGTSNILNPETGGNLTVTTVSSGNTDLDPEKAHTVTAGIVLTPSVIPDLKLSLDYYDIDIKDVISSVGAQTIVDFCYDGAASYCSLVQYNTEETATVQLPYLNLASLTVKGWDAEASYRLNLASLSDALAGNLDFNYYVTYQPTVDVDNGTSVTNRAGDMGSSASPYGGPKWKWNGMLTYSLERLSTTLGVRYVGAGKKDVTYTAADIDDNSVDSVFYTSVAIGYDLPKMGESTDVQLYGNVQNLFDVDPPVDPISSSGNPYNATFHDVVGRTYMVGLRARF